MTDRPPDLDAQLAAHAARAAARRDRFAAQVTRTWRAITLAGWAWSALYGATVRRLPAARAGDLICTPMALAVYAVTLLAWWAWRVRCRRAWPAVVILAAVTPMAAHIAGQLGRRLPAAGPIAGALVITTGVMVVAPIVVLVHPGSRPPWLARALPRARVVARPDRSGG